MLWVVLSNAVAVDFPAWNSHWEVDNGLWVSTCSALRPYTCLSNSLLRINNSELAYSRLDLNGYLTWVLGQYVNVSIH